MLNKFLKNHFSKEKCYYKTLRLSSGCSQKEIKQKYLKLTKKYHPDINKDEKSKIRFMEIKKSYEILSNKNKRKEYNVINGYKYEDSLDYDESFYEFNNENDYLKFQNIYKVKKKNIIDFEKILEKKLLKEILEDQKKLWINLDNNKKFNKFFFSDIEKISIKNLFIYFGIICSFVSISFISCFIGPIFIRKKKRN